jgi:hypothetical protein
MAIARRRLDNDAVANPPQDLANRKSQNPLPQCNCAEDPFNAQP